MALFPCSQRQDCPNNNVLLVDTNVIGNLIKIKLPEPIDHRYRLVEHFNNFLTGYKCLLERIFNCSIDKRVYVTRRIFDEIDMKNAGNPFRRKRDFKALGTICQNSADYEKMNKLHQSIFSIEEIDETDLRKLRENFQNVSSNLSDQDLSLAVLALQKTLEMNRFSVIITDDEDFISFLKKLRDNEHIDLTFGEVSCSMLAFRHLTDYVTEIYRCCKMEKSEYGPIYLGLYDIHDRRTDMTPPMKMLKRRVLERFTTRFDRITKMKYPDLAKPEFQL